MDGRLMYGNVLQQFYRHYSWTNRWDFLFENITACSCGRTATYGSTVVPVK